MNIILLDVKRMCKIFYATANGYTHYACNQFVRYINGLYLTRTVRAQNSKLYAFDNFHNRKEKNVIFQRFFFFHV